MKKPTSKKQHIYINLFALLIWRPLAEHTIYKLNSFICDLYYTLLKIYIVQQQHTKISMLSMTLTTHFPFPHIVSSYIYFLFYFVNFPYKYFFIVLNFFFFSTMSYKNIQKKHSKLIILIHKRSVKTVRRFFIVFHFFFYFKFYLFSFYIFRLRFVRKIYFSFFFYTVR